uniref:RING-type E3 ubiquitin transferase n=1 Tax=Corethron hystrix TaxID=216773 RepID=A0A7S1FN81_9STRA
MTPPESHVARAREIAWRGARILVPLALWAARTRMSCRQRREDPAAARVAGTEEGLRGRDRLEAFRAQRFRTAGLAKAREGGAKGAKGGAGGATESFAVEERPSTSRVGLAWLLLHRITRGTRGEDIPLECIHMGSAAYDPLGPGGFRCGDADPDAPPTVAVASDDPPRVDAATSLFRWIARLQLARLYLRAGPYRAAGALMLAEGGTLFLRALYDAAVGAAARRGGHLTHADMQKATLSVKNAVVENCATTSTPAPSRLHAAARRTASCGICMSRVAKHPSALPCGHVYCWKCVVYWTMYVREECPTCRALTLPCDVFPLNV